MIPKDLLLAAVPDPSGSWNAGRASCLGVLPVGPAAPVLQVAAQRRRTGEPEGVAWAGYRDPIITTHHNLAAPELADFAAENKAWLRIYRLPPCTPDL